MMDYLIPIFMVLAVARIGRFLAAPNRHYYLLCGSIYWRGCTGEVCKRFKGHWGPHRTSPLGALGWYAEWGEEGKIRIVGMGETFEGD